MDEVNFYHSNISQPHPSCFASHLPQRGRLIPTVSPVPTNHYLTVLIRYDTTSRFTRHLTATLSPISRTHRVLSHAQPRCVISRSLKVNISLRPQGEHPYTPMRAPLFSRRCFVFLLRSHSEHIAISHREIISQICTANLYRIVTS